jgi:hypothetical protein
MEEDFISIRGPQLTVMLKGGGRGEGGGGE